MGAVSLIVIHTDRLDECRRFYADTGLPLSRERHGSGPEHYAAVLDGGVVLELYPTGRRAATGYLRIGLTVATEHSAFPPGRHTLTDPDGRTVDLTVALSSSA
ncbi:hypothetical protein GCM10018793_13040 [Streptomyces sulfonofaciens]|uniref:Guanosine polyphosphate pyrophosphohydrolase n=1 Tax=Streptomyces sulfonofaciens TaxID=68272 RepID=A0A919KV88_9ACTN|nr:VOC family protein [Streptomyces sulfonofaciens]GHH73753.1 hypothetical protein GCM10018793_13040 [Streptomyces sulfonofaciens]